MLIASRPVALFDRYRVPYLPDESTGVDGLVRIARADGGGAEMFAVAGGSPHPRRVTAPLLLDGASIFSPVVDERTEAELLRTLGGTWGDELPLTDRAGVPRSAIRLGDDGRIFIPFDIDDPLHALLEERYVSGRSGLRRLATRGYYRTRRMLPYAVQMALRKRYRSFQDRSAFPEWPIETSLHRLEALLLQLVEHTIGEPLPWLAHWPDPYGSALVLTHDVERRVGYRRVERVRAVEEAHELRSAWYFVPKRDYVVDDTLLDRLRAAGCEIGLHGLRHDGRDMVARTFAQRLPEMRSYAERWEAEGFRSPSTHRNADLLPLLEVDHDSSWSDVARYEPEPGGTCSWLPFFIGDVVELPITLPQDHTIFRLRGEGSERTWIEKASYLRRVGGMALMLTHPDYLEEDLLPFYDRFLDLAQEDPAVWHALPREVAAWWRRRSETVVRHVDDEWVGVGPAAGEAKVMLGAPRVPEEPGEARDVAVAELA